MALRKPQKNVEAGESLIRNPSQKSFFFAFENQKVTRNLLFPAWEHKNKRMAETFVRQTGKKSRTERKENEIILNRRKRALEQKQNPRCC